MADNDKKAAIPDEHLRNLEYPLNKQDILTKMQSKGVNSQMMDVLKRIPNKEYVGPLEVTSEIKKLMK